MSDSLQRPIICLITKGNAIPATFQQQKDEIIETVRKAVRSAISIVQIREKYLTAKQLFEVSAEAVRASAGSVTSILVNDRADVALAAGADGVQLRSDSVRAAVIRRFFPPSFIIGVSAHTESDVIAARDAGANFAVFGPVFETPGKPFTVGPDELRRVCKAAGSFPVLALGGIDDSNAEAALQSGAAGFAAIRFLNTDEGLEFAAKLKNDYE